MREIKVRGCSKEELIGTNQWVVGYGVANIDYVDGSRSIFLLTPYGDYVVFEESVGQYTGLKDKNEKEIYEKDIVEIGILHNLSIKGQVIFKDGCFEVEYPINKGVGGKLSEPLSSWVNNFSFKIKVIGNMYENPELLDVELSKLHLIIDFDNTLVNSYKAAYKAYQEITNDYSTSYDENNLTWGMKEVCPLFTGNEINNLFSTDEFFSKLEIFDNAINYLHKLKDLGCTIEICSIHEVNGVKKKEEWIKSKFPFVDKVSVLTFNDNMDFDKSDIKGDIIIDDKPECLISSDCPIKICYNHNLKYKWSKKSTDWYTTSNWKEIYDYIYDIILDIEYLIEK